MHCTHCGEELRDGAKFCENCGNEVVVSQTVNEVMEEMEPERVEAEVVSNDSFANDSFDTFDSSDSFDSFDNDSYTGNTVSSYADDEKGPIGYSIASMVCGIAGLVFCCCGFIGIIICIVGIVLGIVSLVKGCEGKGMAIAGIICGGLGLLVTITLLVVGLAADAWGFSGTEGLDENYLYDIFETITEW